jgi:hypothetical protein
VGDLQALRGTQEIEDTGQVGWVHGSENTRPVRAG